MAGTKCNAVVEKDSPEGETFSKKSALLCFIIFFTLTQWSQDTAPTFQKTRIILNSTHYKNTYTQSLLCMKKRIFCQEGTISDVIRLFKAEQHTDKCSDKLP